MAGQAATDMRQQPATTGMQPHTQPEVEHGSHASFPTNDEGALAQMMSQLSGNQEGGKPTQSPQKTLGFKGQSELLFGAPKQDAQVLGLHGIDISSKSGTLFSSADHEHQSRLNHAQDSLRSMQNHTAAETSQAMHQALQQEANDLNVEKLQQAAGKKSGAKQSSEQYEQHSIAQMAELRKQIRKITVKNKAATTTSGGQQAIDAHTQQRTRTHNFSLTTQLQDYLQSLGLRVKRAQSMKAYVLQQERAARKKARMSAGAGGLDTGATMQESAARFDEGKQLEGSGNTMGE
ncbi:hypothetical protein LRY65_00020 [Candidatus Woesebacteria bacterium]|nr:hypothetical protein [Candidatus Woesebacteria bacterium]MCD8507272.1 hypothetical protein [Candidatus Woesebacteria bacterium]MCD8526594.1 hypothetical protein [Candidatus Woesebacteria bacterium]MCD8545987.1 hypothetical protein [Candidatus Woesebacteria bacterium]